MYNICPFCNSLPASKKTSHIISDFLTDTLKASAKGNRVYSISKYLVDSKYPFTQDSSKEDYIFCPSCESLFNTRYERHIANTFYKAFRQRTSHFNVYLHSHSLAYKVYTNTDYIIFKKFLILQLYRAHISNLPEFKNVVLEKEHLFLVHKNLYDMDFFKDIKVTVFTTELLGEAAANLILATQINKNSYFIWMNDFLCLFEFEPSIFLIPDTAAAVNYLNNSPRIISLSTSTYKDFLAIIVQIIGIQ